MTTVSKIDSTISEVLVSLSPDRPSQDMYIHAGEYNSRESTGADRAPNTFPGKQLRRVIVNIPGFYNRGVLVAPPDTKVVKKWVSVPRDSFEEDHAYNATYLRVTNPSAVAARAGSNDSFGDYGGGMHLVSEFLSFPDPWTTSDELALLGKLREHVAGSSFNAGVALGESPKALQMIAKSATKIYSAYKAVRRGDPFSAAKVLSGRSTIPRGKTLISQSKPTKEVAANNWLELQYGWLPLVNDAYEGAHFVAERMRDHPPVQIIRVRRKAGGAKKPQRLEVELFDSFPRITLPVDVSSSVQIIARLTEVNDVDLSGLTDPASVAWELVPYSFVADWFIPIGSYLSARGLAGSLTGKYVRTSFLKVAAGGYKAKTTWQLHSNYDGHSIRMESAKVVRTISSTLSIPVPEFKPLEKVASWKRAANSVALLTSLFSRKG